MARAVGVACPESLRVAEVAVHVLPTVVEHATVGKDRGVSLEERGDADLVDVRAVRLHAVEVAHDVAVAHAVLRVARGREHDVAIRQEDGIDVAHALRTRELPEARAVRVHDIDMVVIGASIAHGEHDSFPVPVHLRVADGPSLLLRHDHARRARRGIPRLERALRVVAPLVDLAALEERRRVVVVGPERGVRHVHDLRHGSERRLRGGLRAGLLHAAEVVGERRRTRTRREVRRAAHALARHVVHGHVSPTAGRAVDHAEVDVLPDSLRHVPGDDAHPLAVLADGQDDRLARRTVHQLEARVLSAADLEGDRRIRQAQRRRLDQARLPVVRAVVLVFKRRKEPRAALRVRLARVVFLRKVGDGPRERALCHLPSLQIARLEVVDDPLRQDGESYRKRRATGKHQLLFHGSVP